MDENTAVVLTLQLVALFSIAGALLLYLLCKIRTGVGSDFLDGACPGACKPVLVTAADNAIGLQVSIYFFTNNKCTGEGRIKLTHSFSSEKMMKSFRKCYSRKKRFAKKDNGL